MERDVSCRSFIPIFKYVESKGLNLEDFLSGIPVDLSYIQNTRNWLSRDIFVKAFDRCEEIFNDPLIMYKIGQQGWLYQTGAFETFIKLFLGPKLVLQCGTKLISFQSRFFKIETKTIGPNETRITYTYKDNSMAHRHGCLYNLGWAIGLPRSIWKSQAWIIEEECVCDKELGSVKNISNNFTMLNKVKFGSRHCVHRMKWVKPSLPQYINQLLDKNEALISQTLSELEKKEITLQSKEFELEENEQELYVAKNKFKEMLRQWRLTRREQEVIYLVIKGMKNYDIAEYLGISVETVKKHLSNIFRKLNVRSRTELSAKIFELSDLN